MTIALWIAALGLAVGAGLGVKGALDPAWAARLVGLAARPDKPEGFSEFRATYGGMFAGLHAAGLVFAAGAVFIPALLAYALGGCAVLAAGWLATAAGRAASLAADGTDTPFARASIGFEIAVGALIAAPWIALALDL